MSKTQCLDCRLSTWLETKTGRLHPSGQGRCNWKMPEIRLPASMYFIGSPMPAGGYINRRDEFKDCPQFQDRTKQT